MTQNPGATTAITNVPGLLSSIYTPAPALTTSPYADFSTRSSLLTFSWPLVSFSRAFPPSYEIICSVPTPIFQHLTPMPEPQLAPPTHHLSQLMADRHARFSVNTVFVIVNPEYT